jgi:hypothetical protein
LGIKRERGEGLPEAVAAPATVSGVVKLRDKPLGPGGSGKVRRRAGRKPGDLPSVVVMCGHVGRGVLTRVEPSVRVA